MTTKQKMRAVAFGFAVALLAQEPVSAQTRGTLDPQPLPALAKPDDPATPAKELLAAGLCRRHSTARHRLLLQGVVSPAPRRCRSTARPGR